MLLSYSALFFPNRGQSLSLQNTWAKRAICDLPLVVSLSAETRRHVTPLVERTIVRMT